MINSKKIYIKAYTRINFGDDLFVHILCSRYPNTIFYLKKCESYTDIFREIPNLIIIDDIDKMEFDAIVYIGGSIFIENSKESIFRLQKLKHEIIREGIPTYIIGANFGPYKTEKYLNAVRDEIFPYINSITFRDKYSYNLFKDLDNVHYAPDIVFTLNANNIDKHKNKEIGISIIHHLERKNIKEYYSDYVNKLVEISRNYISLGYKVNLISFCEYEKDMITIKNIIDELNENEIKSVSIYDYKGDIYNLLNKISNLELFIATRFHALILAIKLSVPVIPICYSNKMINVLKDMKINDSKFYTFENVRELNASNAIKIKNSKISYYAQKQFKELDRFIDDK